MREFPRTIRSAVGSIRAKVRQRFAGTTSRLVQKLKRSRRITVVVVEHPAETLTPTHFSHHGANLGSWFNDSAIQSLMISLPVVILEKLADNTTQVLLSEKDPSISDLALERAME